MKLPNGSRADLGTKLEEYTLSYSHPTGRHKARVFESALGITLHQDIAILRSALLDAAVEKGDNGFGRVYNLLFPLATARGSAMVMSGWIILRGEDFPRLITCYIV